MILCRKIVNSADIDKKMKKMAVFIYVLQQNTCSDDFYHLYIASSVVTALCNISFYGVLDQRSRTYSCLSCAEYGSELVKH
jgi:hypothetical protein